MGSHVKLTIVGCHFLPLYILGVETIEPINRNSYGEAIIHADYTHSLIGALFIAFVAGIVGTRLWGKRNGFVIGAVVLVIDFRFTCAPC